jgi:hypothetical protein
MKKLLKWIKRWWALDPKLYVILDMNDSSISFSKVLHKDIEESHLKRKNAKGKVYAFYEPTSKKYGFAVDADITSNTQLADIQYNSKHGCVGFESLNPTVARILYDYGIKEEKVKLNVTKRIAGDVCYYRIEK